MFLWEFGSGKRNLLFEIIFGSFKWRIILCYEVYWNLIANIMFYVNFFKVLKLVNIFDFRNNRISFGFNVKFK